MPNATIDARGLCRCPALGARSATWGTERNPLTNLHGMVTALQVLRMAIWTKVKRLTQRHQNDTAISSRA